RLLLHAHRRAVRREAGGRDRAGELRGAPGRAAGEDDGAGPEADEDQPGRAARREAGAASGAAPGPRRGLGLPGGEERPAPRPRSREQPQPRHPAVHRREEVPARPRPPAAPEPGLAAIVTRRARPEPRRVAPRATARRAGTVPTFP